MTSVCQDGILSQSQAEMARSHERIPLSASRSVANSKSVSFCTSNTIPRSPATPVATLVLRSRPRDLLPTPKDAPFAIGYTFEGKPHNYLPDVVGTLTNGKLFLAEAGMENDKRGDRNRACAEAARRLARIQRGVFWISTERTLTQQRHYNLVYLHARRKAFPAFADLNRSRRGWQPSHSIRAGLFRVRRLMPPHCPRNNESNFTGICGPWKLVERRWTDVLCSGIIGNK